MCTGIWHQWVFSYRLICCLHWKRAHKNQFQMNEPENSISCELKAIRLFVYVPMIKASAKSIGNKIRHHIPFWTTTTNTHKIIHIFLYTLLLLKLNSLVILKLLWSISSNNKTAPIFEYKLWHRTERCGKTTIGGDWDQISCCVEANQNVKSNVKKRMSLNMKLISLTSECSNARRNSKKRKGWVYTFTSG